MASAEPNADSHFGNYYLSGSRRILKKLSDFGIAVSPAATASSKPPEHFAADNDRGRGWGPTAFLPIEHALMDWFDSRDYRQAQALIHHKPFTQDWHTISFLSEDAVSPRLTDDTLCPSQLDAMACVLDACDRDGLIVTQCRQEGSDTIVEIGGVETVRIQPVTYEPFDLLTRDRVRKEFKHVRSHDRTQAIKAALKLPGYRPDMMSDFVDEWGFPIRRNGNLFLGFPSNWTYAMRQALGRFGTKAAQHQEQELVAVFFGASDWHQLTKHQDSLNNSVIPIALRVTSPNAAAQRLFFYTTEEAIFRAGVEAGKIPEPVELTTLSTSIIHQNASICVATKRAIAIGVAEAEANATWMPLVDVEYVIDSTSNDIWEIDQYASEDTTLAAKNLLIAADQAQARPAAATRLPGAKSDLAQALLSALYRRGTPSEQVVFVGGLAIAVKYEGEGTARGIRVFLEVLRIDVGRFHRGETFEIEKAESEVTLTANGYVLRFCQQCPNNHNIKVEIPVGTRADLERILGLAYPPALFSDSWIPTIPDAVPPNR